MEILCRIIIYNNHYKSEKASSFSYASFQNIYIKLLNEFTDEDYQLISKKAESRMIITFPEGLLLEKRKALCFQDDPLQPSKFEIFFKDKEDTVMIKLNLLFTPGNSETGIIHYQVVSPEDNI